MLSICSNFTTIIKKVSDFDKINYKLMFVGISFGNDALTFF